VVIVVSSTGRMRDSAVRMIASILGMYFSYSW
jgi:hypothetical protein